MNEFSLKYLAKFVFEHKVERLAINGYLMPLQSIKMDSIQDLNLVDAGLHSEDLFILSQYLKHNSSITNIDLSKNKIGLKYVEESKVIEFKMKNQGKLADFSYQQHFYDSIGLEHFALALSRDNRLTHLNLSENDLGPKNFSLLQKIFVVNTKIEYLNIADCMIDGAQTEILCKSLKNNTRLQYMYLRNCNIGNKGSQAIANLIENNNNLKELEIFKCSIGKLGGEAIENSLKSNFCIEKLSIGDNQLQDPQIQQI